MVYMILDNGKRLKVKLIGDLVFVKVSKSKLKEFKYQYEIWSYKGKLENFEKGFSSNGYNVLFDF